MRRIFIFLLPVFIFGSIDIDRLMKERIDGGRGAGIVIGIIDDGEVSFYSYGKRAIDSEDSVDEDSIFELGSLSKVFTALLLQDLNDCGELSLDDPMEAHLDVGFEIPKYRGKPIRLKHLATHTSALPYMPYNFECRDISNPFANYSMEALFDFLGYYKLLREPGELYDYSNFGVGLLGYILSGGSKRGLHDILKERIWSPLGMRSTKFFLTEEDKEKRVAIPHLGKNRVPIWDFHVLYGTGGIYSTARDLITFLKENIYGEGELYESMKRAHKVYNKADAPHLKICLGWHKSCRFGSSVIYHNGATGGTRAFIGFCPDTKRGVVVLYNAAVNINDLGFHLVDPRYKVKPVQREVELDQTVLDKYVGRYQHPSGLIFTISRTGRQLTAKLSGYPTTKIYPETHSKFFLKIVTATVDFTFDEEKNVEGLRFAYAGTVHPAKKID